MSPLAARNFYYSCLDILLCIVDKGFGITGKTQRALVLSRINGDDAELVQPGRNLHANVAESAAGTQHDHPVARSQFRAQLGHGASHGDARAEQRGRDLAGEPLWYPRHVSSIRHDVLLQRPGLGAARVVLFGAAVRASPPAQGALAAGAVEPLDPHPGVDHGLADALADLDDGPDALVAYYGLVGAPAEDCTDF
ncbi:hypothetical protein G7054_g7647 [Neopestalotiopsis clavispora]|nr:hypothetical protein G7054_g7647 [Neopestalotiopsis clavispora]